MCKESNESGREFSIEDYVESFEVGKDSGGKVVVLITMSEKAVHNASLKDVDMGFLKSIENNLGRLRTAIAAERI